MIQYLYIIGAIHLIICPFTKVEESFNLQAMHDIIYHKFNLSEFDHFEFPGVVPRTFLGPLFLTLLVSPVLTLLDFLGIISTNKFICQYIVRAALGCYVLFSVQKLCKTIKDTFGDGVALWFVVLTASQYHFMFYSSRPLPNVLVLPLVILAVSSWIKQDHLGLICFSAAAVVIFRFELIFLLGTIILLEVLYGRINILSVLKIGIFASICALITTVSVDSFFWNRLLWPEGEVFWFNAILNKSSAWGVSPFMWYWYSALPRALGCSIILVPFGDSRTKRLIVPAFIFILVLSFLPHKELRWRNRHKSMGQWMTSVFIVVHVLANVCLTCILLKVASENYPGGQAITRLHKLVPAESHVHVYIDNLSAQTGVSRFTQIHSNWIYNKTENLSQVNGDYDVFSHLLLEARSKYSPNLKPFVHSHEILDVIEGFSHIHFNYNSFPPFKIKSKPMIFILKRNQVPKPKPLLKIDHIPKSILEKESKPNIKLDRSPKPILKIDNAPKITTKANDDSNLMPRVSNNITRSIEIGNKNINTEIQLNRTFTHKNNMTDTLNELSEFNEKLISEQTGKKPTKLDSPPKMDVDDLFDDTVDYPLDSMSKKITVNRIVKNATFRDKKIN